MSYPSYTISPLDALALEPFEQDSSQVNEEQAAADLALWTNAKFTYDITPGQGILDDKSSSSAFDLDKAMYEHLAKFMDLVTPTSAPDATTASTITPNDPTRATANTTTTTTAPFLSTHPSSILPQQQLLQQRPPTILPKPSLDNSSLFLLPTVTNSDTSSSSLSSSSSTTTSLASPLLNSNGKRLSTVTDERAANDDDKRRRNTAASARFRVKKKQKEQAMQQTVREMTDKTDKLQNRVHELENEIKWLRELLLEKNTKK